MKTVLFACVHNAGRSQMAAALFNALADPGRAQGISAGTQPGDRVHPIVATVMQELGIDLTTVRPRLLTQQVAEVKAVKAIACRSVRVIFCLMVYCCVAFCCSSVNP
jgi:protein-tyrosine-phosphatase